MDWLIIDGIPPWDGRYEFNLEGRELTTREWGWIKRYSGYLPLTIDQGFNGADPELFAVFAAIALHRAGKIRTEELADVYDRIADAPFGTGITLETDTPGEAVADPTASSAASESTSGPNSNGPSASQVANLFPSGVPGSVTSPSPPTASGT